MAAKVTSDSPPSKRICLSHEAQPSNNPLLDLPLELLEKIYQFLDPKSALALSLTNRALRQIFTNDAISRHFITQHFKVKLSPDMPHPEQLLRLIAFHLGKSAPTLKATLRGHSSQVTALAMTPDSSRVISGSDEGTLRIWNAKTKQCLHTLLGHTSIICDIKISPDGSKAISSSDMLDQTIRLWDITTGEYLRTFRGGWGTYLNFFSDGSKAISGGFPVRIWDVETGECLRVLADPPPDEMIVKTLAVTPDDSKLISVCVNVNHMPNMYQKAALYIHDLTTGRLLQTFSLHSLFVTYNDESYLFPNCSKGLVINSDDDSDDDNHIKVWNLQTGKILYDVENANQSQIFAATLTYDGSKVISGAKDGSIWVSDLATKRAICVKNPEEGNHYIDNITLSPDGMSAYFTKGNEILDYDLTAFKG